MVVVAFKDVNLMSVSSSDRCSDLSSGRTRPEVQRRHGLQRRQLCHRLRRDGGETYRNLHLHDHKPSPAGGANPPVLLP